MEKTSKKSSPRLQLVIAVMIMAALFLGELYVMINQSQNVVLLIAIAVLILISLYFVIDAVLDCMNEKDIANREQYDSISRSEKASYMLLKKNLEELSKQVKALNEGNGKNEAGSDEIIKSQKAIAKAAMAKSKETQDRLFIELNNIEASLNHSIHGLSEKLSGFQEEIERLADHIAKINAEAIKEAVKNNQGVHKRVEENAATYDEIIEETESKEVEFEEVMSEEVLLEETEIGIEPELYSMSDAESESEELDLAGLDLGGLDLDESSPIEAEEDILSQLLAAEEVAPIEEVDALEELAKVVDEIPAAQPAPAPADNGGKMNQDDIAALIASMSGDSAAPTTEPIVEEKPTAPVADNPNKMMTPEEIAALLANM